VKKIISNAVQTLTGWKRFDVKLSDRVMVMKNKPITGRWAQRSKTYTVQVLDRGRSKSNFGMIIGTVDVGLHPTFPFSHQRRGADRLYRFVTPQYLNGHSYRPLNRVVGKKRTRPVQGKVHRTSLRHLSGPRVIGWGAGQGKK
jgi:hypothetical protein